MGTSIFNLPTTEFSEILKYINKSNISLGQ